MRDVGGAYAVEREYEQVREYGVEELHGDDDNGAALDYADEEEDGGYDYDDGYEDGGDYEDDDGY